MVVWNLEDIYSFKETDKLIKDLESKVSHFENYRGSLNDKLSVHEFMKIFQDYEAIDIVSTKLSGYAHLKLSENTSDAKVLAHESKITDMLTDMSNKIMFFNLWFKQIPDKQAKEYIGSTGKYAYFFERMRALKDYTLSEKEEKIISLKNVTGDNALTKIYDMFTSKFRYKFKGKEISLSELIVYVRDQKHETRKAAYDLLLSKYEKEGYLLGEIYKNIVLDVRNEDIKLRNFKTPMEVRNISNDVSKKAVDALLNSVKKNAHLFHEFFTLKGKILGIDRMTRYDVYAPYKVKEKNLTYEQSKKIVLDTFYSFSEEFGKRAEKVFNEKHVHSDLTENKRSGAFCSSLTVDVTPYVLLNFTGKMRDVETLAHEMGHAVHDIFAAEKQTNFTSFPSLTTAETASNFGEMLLTENLLKRATKKEKISILMNELDGAFASILRQAYFTIFEEKAHEMIAKGASSEELDKLYLSTLKEQFGDSMEIDEKFQNEWKYIAHMFHTPFYCYAYSFGNLLVLSLYEMYKQEGKSFIPKYIELLSKGGSESPAKMLKPLGVDIESEEFWHKGFSIIRQNIRDLEALTS